MRNFGFLVFVIACGGGGKTPAKPTSGALDCAQVGEHVSSIAVAEKPRPGITPSAIKDMIVTRCQADAWSDDTKQCLHAIATVADGRACASKMTEEQRTAMKTAAQALRKDAEQPPTPDPDASSDWVRHVVEEPGTKTR